MKKQTLQKSACMFFLFCLSFMIQQKGIAQPIIKGPVCVIPGTTYQYFIKSNGGKDIRVSVAGGLLRSGDTSAAVNADLFVIYVIWSDTAKERKITARSSTGKFETPVYATIQLEGGIIEDTDIIQLTTKDPDTYIFHCKAARGGSCNPVYSYRWQVSDNAFKWTDISGATEKDLSYPGNIAANKFFRRVTTETHSNTIAYSNVAEMMINYQ